MRLRVWERGVGADAGVRVGGVRHGGCGGAQAKLTDRKVRIVLDGGALDIEWRDGQSRLDDGADGIEFHRRTRRPLFRGWGA